MQTAREHQQVLAMLVKSDLFRYYSERMIGLIMTGAEEVCLRIESVSSTDTPNLTEHQSSHALHPLQHSAILRSQAPLSLPITSQMEKAASQSLRYYHCGMRGCKLDT